MIKMEDLSFMNAYSILTNFCTALSPEVLTEL